MAIAVFTSFGQQLDTNGDPVSGALVNVYAANSTTPLTVYSNDGLSVSAANPIVCDSAGRHAMRYIATASYKVVVTDSSAATIYTRDNIDPGVGIGSGALPVANGGTAGTTAAAARTNLAAAAATDMATAQSDIANLQTWSGYTLTTKSRMASGTTLQQPSAGTAGSIRFDTDQAMPLIDNGAAWKQVAIQGNFDPTLFAKGSGTIGYMIQRSITAVGATQSITASIPADGTVPDSSEGTQITNFSVSFTPKNSSSKIIVTVEIDGGSTATTSDRVIALFRNSAAAAVRSTTQKTNNAAITNFYMRLRYEESPGSTSAITYAVRAGVSAGTFYINTDANAVTLGGATGGRESYLIIEEWWTP